MTLSEPTKERSSLTPGVSGESMNTPRGPKAWDEWGIDKLQSFGDSNKDHAPVREPNADDACFKAKTDTSLSQDKEESSLKP